MERGTTMASRWVKFRWAWTAAVVVGMLATATPTRAEIQVGVVDIQLVIDSTKEGKKARETLNKEQGDRQTLIESKRGELKKKEEEYTQKQSLLAPSVREEKQKELQEMMMDLQKLVLDSEKGLKQKYASLTQDLLKKIQTVVGKIAAEKKLDLVLEKGQVPYYSPSFEITKEVIKLYDQNNK
jgi:outer membrane protein